MKKKIEAKKVFSALIVVVLALTVFSCDRDLLGLMQKLEVEDISGQGRSTAITASEGGSSVTGTATGDTVIGSGGTGGAVVGTSTGGTVTGGTGTISEQGASGSSTSSGITGSTASGGSSSSTGNGTDGTVAGSGGNGGAVAGKSTGGTVTGGTGIIAETGGNDDEANSVSIIKESTILSEGGSKGNAVEESSGITTVNTTVTYETSVTVSANVGSIVIDSNEINVVANTDGNAGEANSDSTPEAPTPDESITEGDSKGNAVEESSGITTVNTTVTYETSVTVSASGINSFADGSMAVVDSAIKTYNVNRVSAIQQLTNNGGVYTVILTGAVDNDSTNDTINKIRNALQGNSDVKIYLDLSSVTGLKKIPVRGFKDCVNLAGIVLPDSVTTIGNYAFAGCTLLTDITIPKNVNAIGRYAFSGCTGLKNVTFSDASGWCYEGNKLEGLGNTTIAAGYLKAKHTVYYWYKK